MFGVAGLAEPIAAVVEAMAVFLFRDDRPSKGGPFARKIGIRRGWHTVRRKRRMFHAIQHFGAKVAYWDHRSEGTRV
jgi:hypothetical protein